jgi:hypothetical protein
MPDSKEISCKNKVVIYPDPLGFGEFSEVRQDLQTFLDLYCRTACTVNCRAQANSAKDESTIRDVRKIISSQILQLRANQEDEPNNT